MSAKNTVCMSDIHKWYCKANKFRYRVCCFFIWLLLLVRFVFFYPFNEMKQMDMRKVIEQRIKKNKQSLKNTKTHSKRQTKFPIHRNWYFFFLATNPSKTAHRLAESQYINVYAFFLSTFPPLSFSVGCCCFCFFFVVGWSLIHSNCFRNVCWSIKLIVAHMPIST